MLRRDRMSQHLEHCCASAVCCAVQWNRRTLSNYAKRKLKRFAKGLEQWEIEPQMDDREIDVSAALIDQVFFFFLHYFTCKRFQITI